VDDPERRAPGHHRVAELLRRPAIRTALAFAVLFVFFQAPDILGVRTLHSRGAQALLMGVFYVVALAIGRGLGYRGFEAYRLELRLGWAKLLVLTLALGLGAKAASLGAGLWLGSYRWIPLFNRPQGGVLAVDLAIALVTTFLPSAAEDILTRGLWRPLFLSGWRFVLFTSVVYLLNHVFRLGAGPGEWLLLLAFGFAYATAFWVSGSLWAAVGLHWGWNLGNVLPLLFVNLQVPDRGASRAVSVGAHLVLAGLFLLGRRWWSAPGAQSGPAA
jgi:uncharacterized protein